MGFEYKDIKLGGVLNPGKITAPGALSVKPDNTFRDLALKGAFDSIGGLWKNATSAEDTGFDMWGSELGAFDTAYDAEIKDSVTGLMRPKNNDELIGAIKAKEAFQKGHPNAGKAIWNRPGWTEYVPNFFMEGGSNYQVPENAIASRNVEDIRAKWKPNWSGSQETKTVEAPVVAPDKVPLETVIGTTEARFNTSVDINKQIQAFNVKHQGKVLTNAERAELNSLTQSLTLAEAKINKPLSNYEKHLESLEGGAAYTAYARANGSFHPEDPKSKLPWSKQKLFFDNWGISPSQEFLNAKPKGYDNRSPIKRWWDSL
jgi:hypothetical protein